MKNTITLWKKDKITGYWNVCKNVLIENAEKYLEIFLRYEPESEFKISKRRPK